LFYGKSKEKAKGKYDPKLAFKGSFEEVIKVSVTDAPNPEKKPDHKEE
jgi:hypothetical protein